MSELLTQSPVDTNQNDVAEMSDFAKEQAEMNARIAEGHAAIDAEAEAGPTAEELRHRMVARNIGREVLTRGVYRASVADDPADRRVI